MPLTHQLVVLVSDADVSTAAFCGLARTSASPGLSLRDAAAMARIEGHVVVTEVVERWPERRSLGDMWWKALASAADSCRVGSSGVCDAEVSRSFLLEVLEALEGGLVAVALVADTVEVGSLLQDVSGEPFVRVIYGSLPESAIDDLCALSVKE